MSATKMLTIYTAVLAGFFLVAIIIGHMSPLHRHYLEWGQKQEKAREYLTSDVCMSAAKRAKLEGHNKCGESENILAISAYQAAFTQTMKDVHICGDAGCYFLMFEITNSIWKLALTLGVLCFIGIGFGFHRVLHRTSEAQALPGNKGAL